MDALNKFWDEKDTKKKHERTERAALLKGKNELITRGVAHILNTDEKGHWNSDAGNYFISFQFNNDLLRMVLDVGQGNVEKYLNENLRALGLAPWRVEVNYKSPFLPGNDCGGMTIYPPRRPLEDRLKNNFPKISSFVVGIKSRVLKASKPK